MSFRIGIPEPCRNDSRREDYGISCRLHPEPVRQVPDPACSAFATLPARRASPWSGAGRCARAILQRAGHAIGCRSRSLGVKWKDLLDCTGSSVAVAARGRLHSGARASPLSARIGCDRARIVCGELASVRPAAVLLRERAVADGRSYRRVARDIGISRNTVADIVKRHRENCLAQDCALYRNGPQQLALLLCRRCRPGLPDGGAGADPVDEAAVFRAGSNLGAGTIRSRSPFRSGVAEFRLSGRIPGFRRNSANFDRLGAPYSAFRALPGIPLPLELRGSGARRRPAAGNPEICLQPELLIVMTIGLA